MRLKVLISLTNRCNFACTHCATSCGGNKTNTLSIPFIQKLIPFLKEAKEGILEEIHITGGEPLLYPELLLYLLTALIREGFYLSVQTNGSWLLNTEFAEYFLNQIKGLPVTFNISTDQYHATFMPIEKVRDVIQRYNQLGFFLNIDVQKEATVVPLGRAAVLESALSPFSTHCLHNKQVIVSQDSICFCCFGVGAVPFSFSSYASLVKERTAWETYIKDHISEEPSSLDCTQCALVRWY